MINRDITSNASTPAGLTDAAVLGELTGLLEKQIALARQGKLKEVESLTGKIDQLLALAGKITPSKVTMVDYKRIQSLHNELCLILQAEKADLGQKLTKLKKGKKSLRGYHDAIGMN